MTKAKDLARELIETTFESTRYEAAAALEFLSDEVQRLRGIVPQALEDLNDGLCDENEELRAVLAEALEVLKRLHEDYEHYSDGSIDWEIEQGNEMIIPHKEAREVMRKIEKAIR